MSIDIAFHYPPELMNLLVDVIPLINRGKKDVFLFFRGAGISEELMSTPYRSWKHNPAAINKYEIVRQILTRLNEGGGQCLRERREVLKRVTEFQSFSACWENDKLKARGLIAEIQHVVNVKDSFTRMNIERARERKSRIANGQAEKKALQQRKRNIDQARHELFQLFTIDNAQDRGRATETALNNLFKAFQVGIRDAFTLCGDAGEGVLEQIDGVVEFDAHIYFVEMKWWTCPLGVAEVSQHLIRIYHRSESRAIIISASEFTAPAVTTCKDALQQKVVVLCTLQEIVMMLESQGDLLRGARFIEHCHVAA